MPDFLKPLIRSVKWRRQRDSGKKQQVCALPSCARTRTIWQWLIRRRAAISFQGKVYCSPKCLETELLGKISQLRTSAASARRPNRIPLGLLMVARGKITDLELRAALEAQRRARYGTIGDWIEKLGFASEQDVTTALALQWGCPVASSFGQIIVKPPGNVPFAVMEAFQMIPFDFARSTRTLYLAFGARVDHAALYAIEKILDCRTQPCVASARIVRKQLEHLRQFPRPSDVEFFTRDLAEMARITSSYIGRLNPEDVRLSRVGSFIWLRMMAGKSATNLLFCQDAHSPRRFAPDPPSPSLEFLHPYAAMNGLRTES